MSEEKKELVTFCEIQPAYLLVSSLIPLGTRVQRLGGIFWEGSFICVCYVCYCTTWITVLCISLTHRGAGVVKLHALHIDVVSLFEVSSLQRVISQQRKHLKEKKRKNKSRLCLCLQFKLTVFCTLQFYTNICLLKCNLYSTFSPTRSVFMSIAVPLLWPQIQLTVSENRLILAKSYFTGTVKQKNNSKVCLSRKPVWKFNKWLFLSQCSHNWWSEMGTDVGQRFRFSELIVIRISCKDGTGRSTGLLQSPPPHRTSCDNTKVIRTRCGRRFPSWFAQLLNQFIDTQNLWGKKKN